MSVPKRCNFGVWKVIQTKPYSKLFFLLPVFVGGDPKSQPQHLERTRVVGLDHQTAKQKPGNQRYKSHRRHHSSSTIPSKAEASEKKQNVKLVNDKFKLWEDGPNFDTSLRQNVVALVGRTAYLTCRVFDRGNKTVSLSNFFDFIQFQKLLPKIGLWIH